MLEAEHPDYRTGESVTGDDAGDEYEGHFRFLSDVRDDQAIADLGLNLLQSNDESFEGIM